MATFCASLLLGVLRRIHGLERYNMEVYEPNIRRAKGLDTKNSKIRVLICFARNFHAYTWNLPEKQIETLTFDF